MERLEYKEDISIDQVLLENEGIIMNATFDAIHKNYSDSRNELVHYDGWYITRRNNFR